MRVTLVYNPGSGEEEHEATTLVRLLEEAGHVVRHGSVKDDSWVELLEDPGDLLVAAGGDGTVHKVFKRMLPGSAETAIIPLGSANNIARTLGLAGVDPATLIAGLPHAPRRQYDLGTVSMATGEETLVESAGGGIFADVLERSEDFDADGAEKVELGLRLLHDAVVSSEPRHWEIEVDGSALGGDFLAVEVTNIRETGANVPLSPAADPGDGRFDVVRIAERDRGPLAAYLAERIRDVEAEPPALDVTQGASVSLRPPKACRLRVDDDLQPEGAGGTRVTVELRATALRVAGVP
jgi:diacylglycerol kinase family enzyme